MFFLWFQVFFLSLSQSQRRRGAGGALVRGYNKETRHRQHRRCFFMCRDATRVVFCTLFLFHTVYPDKGTAIFEKTSQFFIFA